MKQIIYNTDKFDKKEKIVLDYLNTETKHKKRPLKLTGKFHQFDFINEKYMIELKTRSCKHNQYPTLMMNTNKLKHAEENPQYRFRFYFLFTDGLYKWNFNKLKYTKKLGGRTDRNDPRDIKIIAHIPQKDLILVNSFLTSGIDPINGTCLID